MGQENLVVENYTDSELKERNLEDKENEIIDDVTLFTFTNVLQRSQEWTTILQLKDVLKVSRAHCPIYIYILVQKPWELGMYMWDMLTKFFHRFSRMQAFFLMCYPQSCHCVPCNGPHWWAAHFQPLNTSCYSSAHHASLNILSTATMTLPTGQSCTVWW